ncbi:MAG: tellurite methyltransferase [Myxococcota bacterium]|jgi:tellurite methyltransferase
MNSQNLPAPPARWLDKHLDLVAAASRAGPVLDLACGLGRNALYLASKGVPVVAMDRNPEQLRGLSQAATALAKQGPLAPLWPVRCDLETTTGVPARAESVGAVLVFRFLFRPLAPAIEHVLKPGGIVVYETFAKAHMATGRGPRREAFYLAPDELPALFPGLEVVAFEEGPDGGAPGDITSRLVARKPA